MHSSYAGPEDYGPVVKIKLRRNQKGVSAIRVCMDVLISHEGVAIFARSERQAFAG